MRKPPPTKETITQFKKELRELLKKYNADIWVALDGDTHGVSYELLIDIDNNTIYKNEFSSINHREL